MAVEDIVDSHSGPREKVVVIGVDPWGRFLRPDLQAAFITFCLEQRNVIFMSVVVFLITVWAVLETIAGIILQEMLGLYFGIPVLLIIVATWIILAIILITSRLDRESRHQFWNTPAFQGNLQSLLIICIFSIVILKLLEQVSGFSYICQPSMGTDSHLDPNDDAESQDVPPCPSPANFLSIVSQDMVLVMCFCPMLLSPLFYEPKYYLVIILQLVTGFIAVYSVMNSFLSVIPLVVVLAVIGVSGYELHRQRLKSFIDKNQLKEILREREKNADRLHAMEMRSMIGNPLSSFTTGLDLIEEIMESTQKKLAPADSPSLLITFQECLTAIHGYLANIRNTNAFMLMTINRCIDYTKASKGMKLTPKNETCVLTEVLAFPIDCMRNIQERISIRLEPVAKEICSQIITDKQWLQENLLCLLSNAVKYSSGGEVTIQVSLVPTKPTLEDWHDSANCVVSGNGTKENTTYYMGYLLFEIEDTGIGISEEVMKSLFSPFKQAQRLAGGTGLGLYSLAKRVEALQGSYGVRHRRDGTNGSLFWFAIPYRPDASMPPPSASIIKKVASVHPIMLPNTNSHLPSVVSDLIGLSLEILVVDDSPAILKMSSMMLKRQGHQIWMAENGAIALQKIEEKWKESGRGFDLVLMDLQMPVMDGFEATKRLRTMEAKSNGGTSDIYSKHQLLIGVSANSDHDTMAEALTVGFDEFLSKPFSAEVLMTLLQKLLPANLALPDFSLENK